MQIFLQAMMAEEGILILRNQPETDDELNRRTLATCLLYDSVDGPVRSCIIGVTVVDIQFICS